MGLETLELRPYAPEDSAALEGFSIDGEVLANTVLIDGEVTAYAGILKDRDRHHAFFHVADNDRGRLLKEQAPLFVFRVVRDAVRTLHKGGVAEIHVLCDERFPKSRAFLKALGFQRAERLPWDLLSIEVRSGCEMWVSRG